MKMKKMIAILLMACMTTSMLAACTSSSASTSSTSSESSTESEQSAGDESSEESAGETGMASEITFWGLNTRQNAIDEIVAGFKEETGINVKVSYYDVDGIKDATKIAASSGTLPTMWFNWGGALGSFYAENGLTYDLTAYAEENGWADKYDPSAISLSTFDGELSGIPTSYNVLGIYYRKDIFEENNIEIPTTLEEFEAACDTLVAAGITPMSTGGLNGWHVMRYVEQLIEYYAGAELHDSMNTFDESYNNDAVVQALAKYQEWVEAGYFPNGFITSDPNDALTALYTGNAAMDLEGQWADGMIVQNEQDINNFGFFPFPSNDEGSPRLSAFVEIDQINANVTPEELEAAVAFNNYYYNDANIDEFGEYMNLPVPFQDAEMPEGLINVPDIIEFGATNGTFTITDQAFPTQVADALFNQQDALANKQVTPEDAAAAIQAAIESYLATN